MGVADPDMPCSIRLKKYSTKLLILSHDENLQHINLTKVRKFFCFATLTLLDNFYSNSTKYALCIYKIHSQLLTISNKDSLSCSTSSDQEAMSFFVLWLTVITVNVSSFLNPFPENNSVKLFFTKFGQSCTEHSTSF